MININVVDGFIVSMSRNSTDTPTEEWLAVRSAMNNIPPAREGCGYKLRADTLEWEEYELPPAPEPDPEETEITLEDALEKLRELGVEI